MLKFTFEVMDDYGYWRREKAREWPDAKAAIEAMAEFVAHSWVVHKLRPGVRLVIK